MDNGQELAGRMLDQRPYLNRVELDFSWPGTPPVCRASSGLVRSQRPSFGCTGARIQAGSALVELVGIGQAL